MTMTTATPLVITTHYNIFLFILLLFLLHHPHLTHSFGTSSSKRNSGGGFGRKITKNKSSFDIVHEPDSSSSTQILTSTLSKQGAILKGTVIGINKNTAIRGLYATKNFKQGDIVCQIPSDMGLALSDPSKGGSDVPTMAHCGLNFLKFYGTEQAKQMWSFYLDTLPNRADPNSFQPTPDFFSDKEIAALEFPRLIQKAHQRKSDIDTLATESSTPLDELQFATWIASTRSFDVAISEPPSDDAPLGDDTQIVTKTQKKVCVLVPYLDMINHSSNHANVEITILDPEKDDAWFAIRAKRSIREGKEITLAYGAGALSSDDILMNYAFVPNDENKIDEIMLRKGGEGVFGSVNDWSTTLDEDVNMLEEADWVGNMKTVLELRVRLKKSYQE